MHSLELEIRIKKSQFTQSQFVLCRLLFTVTFFVMQVFFIFMDLNLSAFSLITSRFHIIFRQASYYVSLFKNHPMFSLNTFKMSFFYMWVFSSPGIYFGVKVRNRDPILFCVLSHLSCVQLVMALWTVAHPSSSVHGILQATILEWVAILFSGGSGDLPEPRDQLTPLTCPTLAEGFFTTSATWEAFILPLSDIQSIWTDNLQKNIIATETY